MYNKLTIGFVIQKYDGTKCVEQSFIAGDQVDYEDLLGNSIEIDTSAEEYFPFEMKQPIIEDEDQSP